VATISVTPQTFHYVTFDADQIATLTSTLADQVGFPADATISVEIDERTPLGRARIDSLDPLALHIEGGAIEEPTEPRTLSGRLSADVIGRLLFRAKDRIDGGFADAPADADLTLQQQTAWDTYAMGRLERLGYDVRPPRRQYHFRNRHGFTDVVDRIFTHLWGAEALTWADIDAACQETAASKASA